MAKKHEVTFEVARKYGNRRKEDYVKKLNEAEILECKQRHSDLSLHLANRRNFQNLIKEMFEMEIETEEMIGMIAENLNEVDLTGMTNKAAKSMILELEQMLTTGQLKEQNAIVYYYQDIDEGMEYRFNEDGVLLSKEPFQATQLEMQMKIV